MEKECKKGLHIAIVDDNIFLAKAVEKKLSQYDDFTVSFISEGGKPILSHLQTGHLPDIILMDIEMPGIDGIQLTKKIKSKYPHIHIIMLTVFSYEDKIFEAIKAGASGYLLKDTSADQLKHFILDVINGGAAITPSIALKILTMVKTESPRKPAPDIPQLTDREKQVLLHLKTGKKYDDIASALDISYGTVRKHIENIYKKLHAHNKVEAITIATDHRLI